ncbi:conserved serine-threonine rich protein [Diplodia corticola]|uniref:Conserved serine-threonine rich protein n=1 Tax=Diplodia corticola TaxID=236234 RepID=A0A1J9RPD6_9PEZI|nr:conserved serine-threonine rich protein [Diplodia corticola]OJD29780.1 conserved serine-threonine rich protein [Diplodia corticola]
MLAHSINRGVSKRPLPRVQLPSVLARSVSNWGRRGWPRWRDEADEEWRQFQLKMDAFHKQIEADPYEAIFGRSNEILRGIRRSPPADPSPTKAVPISTESETKPTANHQPAVELSYDPITGRMAPKYGAPESPAVEDPSIHYSQSHHDPRDDSLSAYDKKPSSTPAQSSDWLAQERLNQTRANTAEQDQLRESLAKYDNDLREQPQRPPAPPSEWLVQEDHHKSTPRKLNLPADDIDLLTATDVRARMGIRKNPNHETAEQKQTRRVQLERDFNSIQAQDPTPRVQETLYKVQEAWEIFDRRRRLADEYAKAEKAVKTSEQELSDILETSLSCAARKTPDDGYSHVPTGLQTSFEREKASGRDLATDIQTRAKPVQYDDGYSRTPMGLQTSFEMEQAAGRSLSEDIQARTEPRNHVVDDGYSREPMGLETSFEREKALGHSLADEIHAKTDPKQYIADDGYSREPTGLETSYQRELDSGRSLEQEIQARDDACLTSPDDGYSHEPTGLQSSFAHELEAVRNGVKQSLEEELSKMSLGAASYSDVCSPKAPDSSIGSATAPPRSVEQRRKQGAAPDELKDWYGYSLKPLGLQTSYEREIEACQNGQRKSLEEELQEQALGVAHGASEFDGQGFSRKPTGLETSFQRELDACANGKRKSLGEELALPVDGGAVETMSTKEEAAKLEAAREQRLHDIALVREVREIYEKYYGKITTTHRQAEGASVAPETFEVSSTEDTGRIDEAVHKSLSSYDEKHPGSYNFTPDNLETELSTRGPASSQPSESQTPGASAIKPPCGTSAADASGENLVADANQNETDPAVTISAKPRVYKLLAFDPSTRSLTTSQTSSTVYSPGEHPIPLSVALSNLSQPARFIPQLTSLQKDGYEPVASAANLLILRLRDDKLKETHKRAPRPNPVDGTTIPLPPTPTMSPTGYINLDPVMENPAAARKSSSRHKDDKKVRKTEPVFSGERRKEGMKGQSVRTVLTTFIWATAACYVAGVAGEVAKGY